MIMGTFGIILLLVLTEIMVDMELYFTSYRRFNVITKYSPEEIQQVLPYYSFANDYESAFRAEFNKSLYEYGYTLDNVDRGTIARINTPWLGNPIVSVEMDVASHDTYQYIFLPIIGISELPVDASRKTTQSYGIEKRYTAGMPIEPWTGRMELDGQIIFVCHIIPPKILFIYCHKQTEGLSNKGSNENKYQEGGI